uniref:Interleukin 15 n=2 Tax=Mus musculus TaxID=10090 RepID=A0A1B0GQZ8_MOUSE
MKILKPYMRNTSISCYLCFLLNSHFLTEAGIHVFILGITVFPGALRITPQSRDQCVFYSGY